MEFEPTTCRVYSCTFVSLRHDWLHHIKIDTFLYFLLHLVLNCNCERVTILTTIECSITENTFMCFIEPMLLVIYILIRFSCVSRFFFYFSFTAYTTLSRVKEFSVKSLCPNHSTYFLEMSQNIAVSIFF